MCIKFFLFKDTATTEIYTYLHTLSLLDALPIFLNKIFGRGIVESTGDFGAQGSLPSHPELLDYLAVSFMEHDWDIKWLIKELVTSATYQQSAKITDKKLQDRKSVV